MENNKKIEITIIVFLFGGILGWLLIPPLFAADTIFLTTENGGTPTSCAPANGLVLAQNLTDLCDVTIISPSTDQIIKYNGSQWVNVAQTTFSNESTSCNNVGFGDAFICVENTNVNLRSLLAGAAISIANDSNTIVIQNTEPESTDCNGQAGDHNIVALSTSGDCYFKNLAAGDAISLSNNATHIVISNAGLTAVNNTGYGTSCIGTTFNPITSLWTGVLKCEWSAFAGIGINDTLFDQSPPTIATNFQNGTGISITNPSGTIQQFTNTAPESTVCANVGTGSQIYKDGNCNFRSILGSPDISVTQQANTVTIDYNGTLASESTVCSGQAGNYNIVASSSGGNCTFKNLLAGTGMSLSSNGTHITITNSSPESTSCTGQSGNHNIVASSSGGNCTFKNLVAGTGISVSNNSTHITITSTVSGESTACSNLGTGTILCSGGNVNIKTLKAGLGLSISNTTNDVTYKTNFVNGTGISITGSTSQTFTNTGVISNSCSGGISCSGTNPSTFTVVWDKLCETTLGSSNDTVTCSFTAKKNLMVYSEMRITGGTGSETAIRFNSDTGDNYATRTSSDGSADVTIVSTSRCNLYGNGVLHTSPDHDSSYMYIDNNISSERKVGMIETVAGQATSAASAPHKYETSCKWDNTSAQINKITFISFTGTGDFNTGSVVTVWGYD